MILDFEQNANDKLTYRHEYKISAVEKLKI